MEEMKYYFTDHLTPESQVKHHDFISQRWFNIAEVFGKSNSLALRGAAESGDLLRAGVVSSAPHRHPVWSRALHRDRRY